MAITLTRVSLHSVVAADSRAMLIAKATALIKGRPLTDAVPLHDALLKLAIEPLETTSVSAYKQSKRKDVSRWSNGTIAGFVACIGSMVVAAILLRIGHLAPNSSWQDVVGHVTGVLAALFGVPIAWYNWFDEKSTRRTVTDWTRHALVLQTDRYERNTSFELRDMPDFAIDRFIAVREACPSASFFVDALHTTDTHSTSRAQARREADPFLVACLGDEEFYLDVWDEPQFERKI